MITLLEKTLDGYYKLQHTHKRYNFYFKVDGDFVFYRQEDETLDVDSLQMILSNKEHYKVWYLDAINFCLYNNKKIYTNYKGSL